MPPLIPQTVPIPLDKGLNTKTDPRFLAPGELVEADNVYRERTGEWVCRHGSWDLTTVSNVRTPITSCKSISSRAGKELVIQTSDSLQAYSPDQVKWFDKGTSPTGFQANLTPLTHSILDVLSKPLSYGTNLDNPDVAYGSGLYVFAWEEGGSAYYSIVEAATGATLKSSTSLTGKRPRVVYAGGYFTIFVMFEGAPSTIGALRIDASTLTIVSGLTVVGDALSNATGTPYHEVQARPDNNRILVAYQGNATGVRVLEWNPATNAASIAAITTAAGATLARNALGWLDHDFTSGNVYLATVSNDATGCVVRTLSGATLVQSAAEVVEVGTIDVRNITGHVVGSTKTVFYEKANATTYNTLVTKGVYSGGASTSVLCRSVGLASKAFKVGSAYCVLVSYESTAQGAYFLLDTTGAQSSGVMARILAWDGGGLTVSRNTLSNVAVPASGQAAFALRKRVDIQPTLSLGTIIKHGICAAVVDSGSAAAAPRPYSLSLMTTGSCPRTYDGSFVYEMGHHLIPEKPTPTLVAGGGLTLNKQVGYKVVFVKADAEGRIWRSAPSEPAFIKPTVAATQNVQLTIPTNRVTALSALFGQGELIIEVYRTVGDGTLYYRHAIISTNGLGVDTVTFSDTFSDTEIAYGQELYTDSGEFPNFAPPPLYTTAMQGNRVVGIPCEDRRAVVSSKPIADGEGIGFYPRLSVRIDADGDNTAVALLGGSIVVFKKRAIYVLEGEWPNNLGQGDLPTPRRISPDVGADDFASVLSTPDGIMFRGAKGFWLLDTGFGLTYIGQGPAAYDDLTIVGSVLVHDQPQARFACSTGKVLVYDRVHKHWSTFTYGWTLVGAATVDGTLYMARTNGSVVYEDLVNYTDLGFAYVPAIKTGVLSLALQTEQRVFGIQAAGRYFNDVVLAGYLFYNAKSTFVDVKSWVFSAGEGDVSDGTWEVEMRPSRQLNRGVQVRFLWNPFSTSRGIGVSTLSLSVGARPGLGPIKLAGTT